MNEEKAVERTKLQWHPAFYAGIQIEFEKESEELIFENEHQLGTRPKEVDVLIIKKNEDYQVKKNIGRFFRKYNLIEYKSPKDYLNIDDFYKVCGYASFYKASSANVNEIKSNEITITFVSFHQPRKMMKQLEEEEGYQIRKVDKGIYYIDGGMFPIQLVITKLISEKDNFWLRNLTDKLKSTEKVYEQYQKHSENELYKSIMDIIVKANRELFKEGNAMCQALFDLYKDELMKMAEEKIEEMVERKAEEMVERKAEEKAEEKIEKKLIEKQKKNIINLMNNTHFTLEQVLDALMISEEERKLYDFG